MSTPCTLPIVGAHFRPPAKALIQSMPMAHPLELRPEPTNPYDSNAVAIWLDAHTLPDESLEELRHTLPGMGSDIDDLMSQRHWHIGYIPKTDAIHLQPRIDAAIEGHNVETDASGDGFVRLGHPAILSFDGTGKPLVTFHI